MDAKQFDDLSRFLGAAPSRRGLLAGLGSGLLVLAAIGEVADAKRSKRKRKNKRKKVRCKRLGDSCTPGGKRTCCGELTCSTYSAGGEVPPRCCKQPGQPCTKSDDCCSQFCFEEVCLDT